MLRAPIKVKLFLYIRKLGRVLYICLWFNPQIFFTKFMAKTKQQKIDEVKQLVEKIKDSKGAAIVSYEGLTVGDTTELRRTMRAEGVTFTMIKKRLLKIALNEAGIKDAIVDDHDKNVSIAISKTDEVAPAKLIATFAKGRSAVELRGGILENSFINDVQIKALSLLPNKEELLAKLVGSLASPMSGLVGVMSGNMRQLVGVLSAIRDQK